jgi:hypothetical protein
MHICMCVFSAEIPVLNLKYERFVKSTPCNGKEQFCLTFTVITADRISYELSSGAKWHCDTAPNIHNKQFLEMKRAQCSAYFAQSAYAHIE